MESALEHADNTPLIEGLQGAIADPTTWWKPGHCPNPKGRGKNSKPRLQRLLNQALKRKMVDLDGRKVPSAVALIDAAIDAAIAGDSKFAKIIFDAGIPKPEVRRDITINNHVSAQQALSMLDAARLTAPIEARGDTHLIDEPPKQLESDPPSEPKG